MRIFRYVQPAALWALLLAFTLTLAACDSDSGGSSDREAVSGTYTVSALTLDPEGSAVSPVDVMGRASDVRFIFAPRDGDFTLQYTFQNDDGETGPYLAGGRYDVDDDGVTLDFDGQDSSKRERLLLPDRFRLQLAGTQVTGEVNVQNVNLGAYSMQDYGNLVVTGMLQITMGQGSSAQ